MEQRPQWGCQLALSAHQFFPTQSEHIHFGIRIFGMCPDYRLVDLHTPPGACWKLIEAIHHAWRSGCQCMPPGNVIVFKCFKNQEIGDIRAKVNADYRLEWAVTIMGSHAHVMPLGQS